MATLFLQNKRWVLNLYLHTSVHWNAWWVLNLNLFISMKYIFYYLRTIDNYSIYFSVIVWIRRWSLKKDGAHSCYCPNKVKTNMIIRIMYEKLKGYWTSITSIFLCLIIEDFTFKQYRNFQLILPMRFHFMRYFENSIIFRMSHRLLCIFIEVDFEK